MRATFLNDSTSVDYDYERTDCEGCKSYCRCTSIYDTRVTTVSLKGLYEFIIHTLKNSKNELYRWDHQGKKLYEQFDVRLTDKYCIDRLLRSYRVYDTSGWEVGVAGGYYGEEISGVSFDDTTPFTKSIYEVLDAATNLDKLKVVLLKEYGHLLDKISEASSVQTVEVPFQDIKIPNDTYKKHLGTTEYLCVDDTLPLLLVDSENRIIDGYHRYCSTKKQNDKIKVLKLT